MEKTLIEIIYLSLTSVVPSTIAILVPLAGAFWIFKVREKTVSEGKIFELGREISTLLHQKYIIGPIEGLSSFYIDHARLKIKEKSREKALQQLLRENLYYRNPSIEPTEEEEIEAANIVVAIATDRIQSLDPPTVKRTGEGTVRNPYGENIETKDNCFPFGTKLYRQWIENFSEIYNNIRTITTSRNYFIDEFLKNDRNKRLGVDRKFVDNWLDEISTRIELIHPIHAKLLTQIQIIDTQVDLTRLGRNISLVTLYGVLLVITGFFIPKLIYLSSLATIQILLGLTLSTFLSYLLIGIRITSAVKPDKEENINMEIFIPKLHNKLISMEYPCTLYNPSEIKDILSISSDLELSNQLKTNLSSLATKIDIFNKHANILCIQYSALIEKLNYNFKAASANQQEFEIHILDFSSDSFDLDGVKNKIIMGNHSLTLRHEEIRYLRNKFTINLFELSSNKRLELCGYLDHLRKDIRSLPSYKETILALNELQKSRAKALFELEKSHSNLCS